MHFLNFGLWILNAHLKSSKLPPGCITLLAPWELCGIHVVARGRACMMMRVWCTCNLKHVFCFILNVYILIVYVYIYIYNQHVQHPHLPLYIILASAVLPDVSRDTIYIKSIFSPHTVPDTQQVINCMFRCLHMAGRQYCHHSWTPKSRSW